MIGELENLDVLIIDDMIDTAGTTVNASKAAMEIGQVSGQLCVFIRQRADLSFQPTHVQEVVHDKD